MKKLFIKGLVLCLLLSLMGLSVYASSTGGSGSCGASVSWTLTGSTLTISGSGEMTDYDEIDAVPWREMRDQITEVVVEAGVTHLGKWCFYDMDSLQSVVLPGTVKSFGVATFRDCDALVELVMPEGLETIDYMAVSDCDILSYLTIPSTLTEIDDEVFTSLPELLWVEIAAGNPVFIFQDNLLIDITSMSVVSGAAVVGQVDVPVGIQYIKSHAFICNPYITGVVLPETVTEVDSMAFYRCENLSEVYLPASLAYFGMYVFNDSDNLTSVNYAGSSSQWAAMEFLSRDDESLAELESIMQYGVPVPAVGATVGQTGVVEQPAGASGDTVGTMETEMWESEDIGSGACGDALEWTVTSWQDNTGNGAFLTITGTGDMWDYSPESPAPWSGYSFDQISVWEGVTSIGDYAFYQENSVANMAVLPASITRIGESAMEGNNLLEVVFYEGTLEQWEQVTVERNNDMLLSNLCYYVPEEDTYYALDYTPETGAQTGTGLEQTTTAPAVSQNSVGTTTEESGTSPVMILIIVALAVLVIAIGTSTAVIITVLKRNKQNQNVQYAPPPPVNQQQYNQTNQYNPYSQYRQDDEQ